MAIIIFFVVVLLLQLAIGTGVLAGALLLTGEEGINKDVLLKCLAIVFVAMLFSLVPYFGLLSGIVWFGALMAVFEKTFLEALLIAVVCWVINIGARIGLGLLVSMFV